MAGRRHVETYRRRDSDWGWRRVSANGNITATSGEGYRREASAVAAARRENPGLPLQKGKQRR